MGPGLFELLPAFSLFALQLQSALTRLLLQPGLPPHPPFKFLDTAFAVAELGRGDLNSDVPDKTLESPRCYSLPPQGSASNTFAT
jgi:hypothetical protein